MPRFNAAATFLRLAEELELTEEAEEKEQQKHPIYYQNHDPCLLVANM